MSFELALAFSLALVTLASTGRFVRRNFDIDE